MAEDVSDQPVDEEDEEQSSEDQQTQDELADGSELVFEGVGKLEW